MDDAHLDDGPDPGEQRAEEKPWHPESQTDLADRTADVPGVEVVRTEKAQKGPKQDIGEAILRLGIEIDSDTGRYVDGPVVSTKR